MSGKVWDGRCREARVAALSPDRKAAREILYKQLHSLLLERNNSVPLEDREAVVKLISHKLAEARGRSLPVREKSGFLLVF